MYKRDGTTLKNILLFCLSLFFFSVADEIEYRQVTHRPINSNSAIYLNNRYIGKGTERTITLPDTGCYIIEERGLGNQVLLAADTIGHCQFESTTIQSDTSNSTVISHSSINLSAGITLLEDHLNFSPALRFGVNFNQRRYLGVHFSYKSSGEVGTEYTLPISPKIINEQWERFISFSIEYERLFSPHKPVTLIIGALLGASGVENHSIKGFIDSRDRNNIIISESAYASSIGFF